MEIGQGAFTLTPTTTIGVFARSRDVGEYLAEKLRIPSGFPLAVCELAANEDSAGGIVLKAESGKSHLGPVRHELTVSRGGSVPQSIQGSSVAWTKESSTPRSGSDANEELLAVKPEGYEPEEDECGRRFDYPSEHAIGQ